MVLAAVITVVLGPAELRAEVENPPIDLEADETRAASSKVVLWALQGSEVEEDSLDDVRRGLQAALSAESGRHLFGEKAFREFVAASSAPVPDCLKGLGSCESAEAMALEALDISLVVRVAVEEEGGTLAGHYELLDRRGEVTESERVEAPNPRELAFELAGDIFDATATVSVRTQPDGARVEIGGEEAGETPLDYRLPLGEHAYRIEREGYRPVEGTLELRDAGGDIVRHDLEVAPGTLIVEGAPDDAVVLVNNEEVGQAGEAIELEPGHHAVEVRADGFESHRDTVRLEPGSVVEMPASLDQGHPLLKTATPRDITANRYIARLSYDHSLHSTTFRDARGELDGTQFQFAGFADDAGALAADDPRRLMTPNGLRFDFSYSWENIGLVLLSTSYTSSNLDQRAALDSSGADDPVSVDVTKLSRLQLRPLQVSYRHFFDNIAPFAELGTGINIQWIRAEGDLLDDAVTLTDSEAFWTLGLGVSYHVTPNVFATARYGAQFYFDQGLGAENVFSLGMGLALPNLFGFEPEPPDRLE